MPDRYLSDKSRHGGRRAGALVFAATLIDYASLNALR
jgi:hypothetical protein